MKYHHVEISLLVAVLYDAIYRPRRLYVVFHHTGIDCMLWRTRYEAAHPNSRTPLLSTEEKERQKHCCHTLAASPWPELKAHSVFLLTHSVPTALSYVIYTM